MEKPQHVQGSQFEQRGRAVLRLQEEGGETNEMNAIIKVDGQTERGAAQRKGWVGGGGGSRSESFVELLLYYSVSPNASSCDATRSGDEEIAQSSEPSLRKTG